MNDDNGGGDGSAFEDSSVEPGVWRYEMADRASVIIDAEDYFTHMQQAMLKAKRRILLIGWDFDTRIHLTKGRRWWRKGTSRDHPSRLGSFILWLNRHRSGLEIRILRWSFGAIKFLGRGSMALDLVRWWPHRRIDFKFDTAHPFGGSHHQKIVVIDNSVAVCGGIDMTTHRWDTREHKEEDQRRKRPRGKPYKPWHDATMMLEGPAATALGDLGRDRWARAGGERFDPVDPHADSAWPTELEVQFENVELGIARTRGAYDGTPEITEIADLFERQIASARKFIYAETQYFASRRIAEAMVKRLREPDPPEIVIVHPLSAEGWLETKAMDTARAALVQAIGKADPGGLFNLYVAHTGDTPIYTHAKITIIDDRVFRIGSANMNNRSMGLDSECDMFIDCDRPANAQFGPVITRLRHSLLAEHCGLDVDEMHELLARYGSMRRLIEERGRGRPRHLERWELKQQDGVDKLLAESELLDPEHPDDIFEPFKDGGLFRERTMLQRVNDAMPWGSR